MKVPYVLTLVAAACLCLSACGQTGPLYLPDRAAQEVAQPEQVPSNPTPESQRDRKTKPGTQDAPATDTHAPTSPADPASPPTQPSDR